MEIIIKSYKDLIVWQKSMVLVFAIYKITDKLPTEERYGLVSQMRRSAVSIPSNIAEGKMRGTRKDYRHFLLNAFGSGAELETLIEISKHLYSSRGLNCLEIDSLLEEIMKMLSVLIKKLNT